MSIASIATSTAWLASRLARAPGFGGEARDRRRQGEIAVRHSVGGVRGEGDVDHVGIAQVDVGMVASGIGGGGDVGGETVRLRRTTRVETTPRCD